MRRCISVLAYAGLRPGEALALQWGDIREQTILVERAVSLGEEKDTKTAAHRTVRLLAPLAADLKQWRLRCGRPSARRLVFPSAAGTSWSQPAYQLWRRRAFRRALDGAGVEHARPYDLRHSFASLLLHEGRSVIYVARQLGHDARRTADDVRPRDGRVRGRAATRRAHRDHERAVRAHRRPRRPLEKSPSPAARSRVHLGCISLSPRPPASPRDRHNMHKCRDFVDTSGQRGQRDLDRRRSPVRARLAPLPAAPATAGRTREIVHEFLQFKAVNKFDTGMLCERWISAATRCTFPTTVATSSLRRGADAPGARLHANPRIGPADRRLPQAGRLTDEADAALRVAVVGGVIGGQFAADALRERDAEIVASKRFGGGSTTMTSSPKPAAGGDAVRTRSTMNATQRSVDRLLTTHVAASPGPNGCSR